MIFPLNYRYFNKSLGVMHSNAHSLQHIQIWTFSSHHEICSNLVNSILYHMADINLNGIELHTHTRAHTNKKKRKKCHKTHCSSLWVFTAFIRFGRVLVFSHFHFIYDIKPHVVCYRFEIKLWTVIVTYKVFTECNSILTIKLDGNGNHIANDRQITDITSYILEKKATADNIKCQ